MTYPTISQYHALSEELSRLSQTEVELAGKTQRKQEALKELSEDLDEKSLQGIQATLMSYQAELATTRSRSVEVQRLCLESQKSLGTEFLDSLKEANGAIANLIQDPAVRGDSDLRALALDEVTAHLEQARELSQFLDELQTNSQPNPVAEQTLPALGRSVARQIPAELSAYVKWDRVGFGLKDFATQYSVELKELLTELKGDILKLTQDLKGRGLNGGTLTEPMVEGMLRNAGVVISEARFVLTSPEGFTVSASNAIDAVRAYLTEVIGLPILLQKAGRSFNASFSVHRDGATHTLKLSGYDRERLSQLLQNVCKQLSIKPPTWQEVNRDSR